MDVYSARGDALRNITQDLTALRISRWPKHRDLSRGMGKVMEAYTVVYAQNCK